MLNSLKIYETLKSGHIPDEQAQAVTLAFQTAEEDFSRDFRSAVADLKAEMQLMRSELKTEIAGVKIDFRAELAEVKSELRADIANLKAELIYRTFIFWVGQFAVLSGLVVALKIFLK